MKVLILRFSSIGDIVLTTPVVRALKNQIPEVSIHYATKKAYQGILTSNPCIEKVHVLEEGIWSFARKLKNEKFDYVIDLHNNIRTRIIKFSLNAKSSSFKKLNFEKWVKVNLKVNILPNKHIVERYFETVSMLNVVPDDEGLDYYIEEKDEIEKEWLPKEFQNGFSVVAIGGGHNTKKLPYKKLIELCDKINRPIVLLGGKPESEMGEKVEEFFTRIEGKEAFDQELANEFGKLAIVFNGCGKFNLGQSASILRDAEYVFAHDTGLMHIAAAFKKRIYSIWGNTIPEFGMYPYKTSFVIFENKKLGCRPCSKLGHSKCPKGHFKCMNDQVFDFYLPE